MTDPQYPSLEQEHRVHTYETHRIPWWIRLLWVGYWMGVIAYGLAYLIPSAKDYF